MKYKGYLISHGGNIRFNNEDNGYLEGQYRKDDNIFSWECKRLGEDSITAGVFDGVGGEDKGEIASRIAAKTLNDFCKDVLLSCEFEEYVRQANQNILDAAEGFGMATTFVLLSIEDNYYHFCNMGDSRGYLLRNKKLFKMTKDHNMVSRMVARGVLTPEQAKNHPDRHAIYQYLGMDSNDGLILEPFTGDAVRARKRDICLLCTDGLTDMVSEADIANVLAGALTLDDKAHNLLDMALEAGGRDNITIILIEAE